MTTMNRGAGFAILLPLLLGLGGCAELHRLNVGLPSPEVRVKLRLPEVQSAQLPNGVQIYVVEVSDVPLIAVRLVLRAGAAAVPVEQQGLPCLAYQALLRGDGDTDLRLRALGAQARLHLQMDGAEVQVNAAAPDLAEVLNQLGQAAQRPRLAEADIAELRRRQLAAQAAQQGDPEYLGGAALLQALYGPDHPYSASVLGTRDSVSRLTRDDVVGFHQRFTGPKNAALVVAGRVTLAQVVAAATAGFGGWSAPVQAPPTPAAPQARRAGVEGIPVPGLPQTLILVGKLAVPAGHPDEQLLRFVYRSPGAMTGARLRYYSGVTYGVGTGLTLQRGGGHMTTALWVQADATGKSLHEVLRQLGEYHDRSGTSADNMYEMRTRRALFQMAQFDGATDSADAAAQLFLYDRPADYHRRLVDRLLEVRDGELRPISRRYLGTDNVHVVLVGDPAVIQPHVTTH